MFWLFRGKKEVEKVKDETRQGFESVKKDITSISDWIKHLDLEKKAHKEEIKEVKDVLSTIQEEIIEMKNIVSVMNNFKSKQVSKTAVGLSNKQTPVYSVQTGVQTGVQTPKLEQFSITERAILWILLNTDMKLSYDDLAAMLGKEKSTIRGQINSIKQKSEIINEQIEKNGKKRLYIEENIKEKMLKKSKVRVSNQKNKKK